MPGPKRLTPFSAKRKSQTCESGHRPTPAKVVDFDINYRQHRS